MNSRKRNHITHYHSLTTRSDEINGFEIQSNVQSPDMTSINLFDIFPPFYIGKKKFPRDLLMSNQAAVQCALP